MATWLRGCICRSRALFGGSWISSSQFRVSLTVGSFIPSRLASGNSWTSRTHTYHLLSFQTLNCTLAPVHGFESPWARVCKPRSLGTYRMIRMIDKILDCFANGCQWLQGDHGGSLARKVQPPTCLPTLSSQPPIHMLSFRVYFTFFSPSLANQP